ncbi:aldo/keto reductase [Pelagicoccus mobilis]|uniref:Aldo/keto reductase n=1 Tax=Pelagicoccus mobilis TaxID=415221 RepID=A0A934S1C3_9BACT|nr:aldo/keto reductase [Pelagicoccus mobilis]MBK1879345.1 aldo/keto reductase [Pelagicoccus mobilis]
MNEISTNTSELLAGTDLPVGKLCLGTANLGLKQSESEAFELLDAFVDLGGRFLDTARVYSDWIPGEKGRCERILGDWIRSRPGVTDKVVIATKGAHYEWSDKSLNRVDPVSIRSDIETSLGVLGLERIPLWFLHRDRPDAPVEEIVDFMQQFVEEGKVRFLGVANWQADRLSQANEYAAKKGLHGFVVNQPGFSLGSWAMSQPPADKTLATLDRPGWEYHRDSGLCLMPYSSQAKGFFSKVLASEYVSELSENAYYSEANLRVAEVVKAICEERGCNANAVVLGYLRGQPFPVLPIVGAYTRAMLEDCLDGIELELSEKEVALLNRAAAWY